MSPSRLVLACASGGIPAGSVRFAAGGAVLCTVELQGGLRGGAIYPEQTAFSGDEYNDPSQDTVDLAVGDGGSPRRLTATNRGQSD